MNAEEALQQIMADTDTDNNDSESEDSEVLVDDVHIATTDDEKDSEEEEETMQEDNQEIQSTGEVTGAVIFGKDGTQWQEVKIEENSGGRYAAHNIIRHKQGSTRFILNRVDTEVDIFFELMGRDWIQKIVTFTLAEARRQNNQNFMLTENDLLAFLGLCFARGVLLGKNEPVYNLWSKEFGRDIFRDTMSRQRFLSIKRYIRFDDKSTRTERRKNDKFTAIRDLWESVMSNCGNCYNPGSATTVDEQLFPCKCRCPFIQFISNKPDKFGVKFWLICDVASKYVLHAIPYVGKDDQRAPEVRLPESVVLKLTERYYGSGISVTTDNFFTSVSLANKLLQHRITLLGTLRSNRREVPQAAITELKSKHIPINKAKFYRNGNCLLTAFKAKKNRVVMLLSTEHKSAKILDVNNKPELVHDYNQTKYGVDVADQMLRMYSSKAACRRWPLSVFFNLLDIIGLNAFIIAKDIKLASSKNRRTFLTVLIKELCSRSTTRKAERPIIQLHGNPQIGDAVQQRVRCQTCQKNKTKVSCPSCSKFVCGSCCYPICKNCVQFQ
jgi:hypothetical protein